MSPEGCNEDVDDDHDADQGGGRIVELVELPLLSYLIEVQPRCGRVEEWGRRVRLGPQPGTSLAASAGGQRKSGTSETHTAESKGGGRHWAEPPSPSLTSAPGIHTAPQDIGIGALHRVLGVGTRTHTEDHKDLCYE